MLTPYAQSRFIEKLYTDRSGQQFKLVFFVALVDGELKAKLISAEAIVSAPLTAITGSCQSAPSFTLSGFVATSLASKVFVPAYAPLVSPFNELFFFTSQPTRAPSSR